MSSEVLKVKPVQDKPKRVEWGLFKRFVDKMDNQPLISAELKHWARAEVRLTGWRRHVNLFLGWATLLVSIILFISELVRALLGSDLSVVPAQYRWLMWVYAVLALVFYTAPWSRSQRLALRMIGRDKSKAGNWELIVLTGVDARTYVLAKWWVMIRTIFPSLLVVGLVRAGALTFLVAELTRLMATNILRYSSNFIIYPPSAVDILMLGLLSVLLTFVGMPSMMALQLDNMLNAPRNGGSWWVTLVRGVLVFCGTIALLVAAGSLVNSLSRSSNNPMIGLIVGAVLLTALDNGLIVTGQLAAFAYLYTQRPPDVFMQLDATHTLLIVLLSLPLTLLSTWFWLRMAEWTARRYHLVPCKRH